MSTGGGPKGVIVQIVVCDGWKGSVDTHVDEEVGVIAGPSMTTSGPSFDTVEGLAGFSAIWGRR